MSLKDLVLDDDVEEFIPHKVTPFEIKRVAAITYEDLVNLGYAERMNHPELWAMNVFTARNKL